MAGPKVNGLLLALGLLTLAGCESGAPGPEQPHPVVVVGVDGASWNAIRDLWDQGQLPHLRSLAEAGVTAELKPMAAASPVIWTTIATGVGPERHGITGFVVPTEAGDLPVTSRVRRVPAIWNMVSTLERRVAALGWWATWPAEEVHGVLVSDRAMRVVEDAVYPPDFGDRFRALAEADASTAPPASAIVRQDRALARVSSELADEGFDLLMVYFRNVDAESHPYWRYFRPPADDAVSSEEIERYGGRVPAAYAEVDQAIGKLVEAAGPDTNLFVVSDHGFRGVKRPRFRVVLDFDLVLERLGYLSRRGGEIDWAATRAVPWNTGEGARVQLVRFALRDRDPRGPVEKEDLGSLKERLTADLSQVTYESGAAAFRVRRPKSGERRRGADLAVAIRQHGVTDRLRHRGAPIPDAIRALHLITGTHDANTHGIFVAAGPDIDPHARPAPVRSLDVTPTLLYAMSLPVARDFDGRPCVEIFRSEFRRRHPVRTMASWGVREPGEAAASEVDAELIQELRALGYLD